jgi:hypothetical protein
MNDYIINEAAPGFQAFMAQHNAAEVSVVDGEVFVKTHAGTGVVFPSMEKLNEYYPDLFILAVGVADTTEVEGETETDENNIAEV